MRKGMSEHAVAAHGATCAAIVCLTVLTSDGTESVSNAMNTIVVALIVAAVMYGGFRWVFAQEEWRSGP